MSNNMIPIMPNTKLEQAHISNQELCLQSIKEYLVSLPSKNSRITMSRTLKIIVKELGYNSIENFDYSSLNEKTIIALITKLNEKYAPSTVKLCLTLLKSIAKRFFINDLISQKEYTLICSVKSPKGYRITKGRALKHSESKAFFDQLEDDGSLKATRDAAIIVVLLYCGLRRSEAANLLYENVHLQENPAFIKVIGKGNKERICYLTDFAKEVLEQWAEFRGTQIGPFFYHITKYGEVFERGLSDSSIYKILKARANILGIKCSPHDLRRTFATNLLAANIDISTVKDMMGHSSIMTTQIYDKRGDDRMQAAINVLNFNK